MTNLSGADNEGYKYYEGIGYAKVTTTLLGEYDWSAEIDIIPSESNNKFKMICVDTES